LILFYYHHLSWLFHCCSVGFIAIHRFHRTTSWHWTCHSGGYWQQAKLCTEMMQAIQWWWWWWLLLLLENTTALIFWAIQHLSHVQLVTKMTNRVWATVLSWHYIQTLLWGH